MAGGSSLAGLEEGNESEEIVKNVIGDKVITCPCSLDLTYRKLSFTDKIRRVYCALTRSGNDWMAVRIELDSG